MYNFNLYNILTPKGPHITKVLEFQFITLGLVKNIIHMRPNLISPKSMKNITDVGQTSNKFE